VRSLSITAQSVFKGPMRLYLRRRRHNTCSPLALFPLRFRMRIGVDATAMCRAAGKLFAAYTRIGPTKAFFEELSSDMGLPITELIHLVRGGN
jgi:hypothetical protein